LSRKRESEKAPQWNALEGFRKSAIPRGIRKNETGKMCKWLDGHCLRCPHGGISSRRSRIGKWGKALRETINSFIVFSKRLSPQS
jgi:hypothetical protein